jgi:hypothetical protein
MKMWDLVSSLALVASGSLLTMLAGWLSDRRTAEREDRRAAAEAQLRSRTDWLLLQRATLTEIQDTAEKLWTHTAKHAAGVGPDGDPLVPMGALIRLGTRLDDRELADDVMTWFRTVRALLQVQSPQPVEVERTKHKHSDLQFRLGQRLRELHSQ